MESGNVPNMGYITYNNISKNILDDDGVTTFVLYGNIILPSNAPEKVSIYVIKENKKGQNYVDTDMVDMIDLTEPKSNRSRIATLTEQGKYSMNYEYEFNDVQYRFQFTLGYFKNGVN